MLPNRRTRFPLGPHKCRSPPSLCAAPSLQNGTGGFAYAVLFGAHASYGMPQTHFFRYCLPCRRGGCRPLRHRRSSASAPSAPQCRVMDGFHSVNGTQPHIFISVVKNHSTATQGYGLFYFNGAKIPFFALSLLTGYISAPIIYIYPQRYRKRAHK